MPRRARLDAPGTLHHVMVRGIEQQKIVTDNSDRDNFVGRMGDIAVETGTAIFAWALMNNHAHILLKSGQSGLPTFMRRLLTGYAVSYNRQHGRYGHLFQNRYKSIICEEDPYFKELVRYIHLNPLRGNLVTSLEGLDRYPWSGHAVILGKIKRKWQYTDYVLKWFGRKPGPAKKTYRRYLTAGIKQGRRPELVGGGLVRSLGGWSAVKALRRSTTKEKSDERILGSGDFVESLLAQADEKMRYQISDEDQLNGVVEVIGEACKKDRVSINALKAGSRIHGVSLIRARLAEKLVMEYGLSLAETARQLGVTTPAIANVIRRKRHY